MKSPHRVVVHVSRNVRVRVRESKDPENMCNFVYLPFNEIQELEEKIQDDNGAVIVFSIEEEIDLAGYTEKLLAKAPSLRVIVSGPTSRQQMISFYHAGVSDLFGEVFDQEVFEEKYMHLISREADLQKNLDGHMHEVATPVGIISGMSMDILFENSQLKKDMENGLRKSHLMKYISFIEESSEILLINSQRIKRMHNDFNPHLPADVTTENVQITNIQKREY